jgi:hypothetical protein
MPEKPFLNDTHPDPEKPMKPDPPGDGMPAGEDISIPPIGSDQAETNVGEQVNPHKKHAEEKGGES